MVYSAAFSHGRRGIELPTQDSPDKFPSSKLSWIIKKILQIFLEDESNGLEAELRRKILIVLEWSGLMPVVEAVSTI